MQTVKLATQFDIPNALHFEEGPNGLVRGVISTPAAAAVFYLQGAHLSHWAPSGHRPVLFVSPESLYEPSKAIRGGVPIIFPWFGPRHDGKPGPAHGFARNLEWTIETARLGNDTTVEITLGLGPDKTTRHLWPGFHLNFRVAIGSALEMELQVRNDSAEPFAYEEALHTYLAVSDIRQASLSGLESTVYIDKTDESRRKQQGNEVIRFTKETDQVHLSTKATCVVHDPVWNRRMIIEKSGSDSTVVWNPWIDKTAGMSDMSADSWKAMLCVETANAAENAVKLYPGASHNLAVTIRIE